MRLFCPEPIWLDRTEEYFQNVVEFYYHLLRQHEELWSSSLFDIQRSLELLTLAGRDGRQPTNPLPMGKVPVYLRRAAINKASATVKSTQELQSGFPEKLGAKVTFFKGMYSDLTDRSICLKLWNGEKWIWTDCKLKGRPFPQDGQLMSPTLVKEGRRYLLNIPMKQENSDARTAKERMAEGTNLCSVRFTNTDIFAVCCILDEQGNQLAVHTCRGGDAYRHRCKLLETRIQKSRPNTVGDNSPQPNRKYYMHLKNLSEHYAHQVSREILELLQRESGRNHCPPRLRPELHPDGNGKKRQFFPASLKQQDPDQPAVQSLGRRNSGAGNQNRRPEGQMRHLRRQGSPERKRIPL
ncbi:MAG: transposase [Blautia faecis]